MSMLLCRYVASVNQAQHKNSEDMWPSDRKYESTIWMKKFPWKYYRFINNEYVDYA